MSTLKLNSINFDNPPTITYSVVDVDNQGNTLILIDHESITPPAGFLITSVVSLVQANFTTTKVKVKKDLNDKSKEFSDKAKKIDDPVNV